MPNIYQVPELGYSYDALEPHISAAVMQLHHDKHHQTYVDKLTAAIDTHPELADTPLVELLANLSNVPEDIRGAIRNNGGGHYNHSLFWKVMSPQGGGQPDGALGEKIVEKYGSFDAFVEKFNTTALGLFGSGWVWLDFDLNIIASPNQDSPIMDGAGEPLMGLDIWEHAYYLDYKNKRDDYIRAWWNVVDWKYIEDRYSK